MCFLSIIDYSNILRIKIKSVYVKDFLISTKVRLKRVEHLHGEEPISSEPTFNKNQVFTNMYLKILFISTITICFLDTFTTAKPKIKQVFDLIATSSHHKLVKRVSNGYKDAFKSTGFAAIQPTVNN